MRRLYFLLTFLYCTASMVANTFAQAPTNGLVGYYPFNGNANDASGNGRHGIPQNGPVLTADRKGNLNSAYSFDGIDDWINIGTNFNFNASFTISLHCSTISFGNNPSLFTQGQAVVNGGLHIALIYQSTYRFAFYGNDLEASSDFPPLNTWAHYVFTYNHQTQSRRVYLNGLMIANDTSVPYTGSGTTAIGKNIVQDVPNGRYNGKLDDIRIYNRALSDAEVQSIYQVEVSPTCPTCLTAQTVANYSTQEHFCAAQGLCTQSIIQKTQTDPKQLINRGDLAKIAYLGLVGKTATTVAENFDVPFVDLQRLYNTDTTYYKYAKVLTYLQYQDGRSPFDYRRNANFEPFSPITRALVLKVLLETFNIDESTATGASPFSDVTISHPFYKYIKKAHELGIITGSGGAFNPDANCSREDAFLMLYRIMTSTSITKPTLTQINAGFFKPGNYTPKTLSVKPSTDRGNFNHYTETSFALSGTVPLVFAHSYNSFATELPKDFYPNFMGPGWTHSFNAYMLNQTPAGSLLADARFVIHYPDGRLHFYKPNAANTNFIPEGLGIYDTFQKAADNLSAEITTPSKIVYKFGRVTGASANVWPLLSIKDRNNNTLTFTYEVGVNTIPRLKTVADPAGRTLNFSYLAGTNYLTEVSMSGVGSFNGRKVTFEYYPAFLDGPDTFQNLKKYTEPDAVTGTKSTEYIYFNEDSTYHLLKQIKLPKGNVVDNQYQNRKLVSSRTLNATGSPVQKMDVNFTPTYGTTGTASTSQVKTTDENGLAKTMNYDHNTNGLTTKLKTTGSNPLDLTMDYGDANDPTAVTSLTQNGTNVGMEYYTAFPYNVKKITQTGPSGAFNQQFEYNSFNDILKFTDAKGNIANFGYNDTGNLTQVTHPIGNPTVIVRNPNGTVQRVTTPAGVQTTFGYNTYGNLTSTSTANGSNPAIATSAAYDELSRLISATDPRGNSTTYQYYANDLLKKTTAPLGFTIDYAYDLNDNPTSITNAKARATTMTYNTETDQLMSRSFEGKTESFTYYQDGALKTYTNKRGNTFTFIYDASGRKLSDSYATYGYKTDGMLGAVSHTQTLNQGSRTYNIQYDYDVLKRISQITCDGFTTSPGSISVQYQYDNNNNLTRLTYPDGKQLNYTYDAKNRMISMVDWANRTTTFTYDDDGKPTGYTLPNGTFATYTYDAAGRMTGMSQKKSTNAVICSYGFELDQAGNHTKENVIEPIITPPTLISGTSNYTTNNANQTTQVDSKTYTFDNNGAITNHAGRFVTYDTRDNLTQYNSEIFAYDGTETRRLKADLTGGYYTNYVINYLNNTVLATENGSIGGYFYFYVYGPTGLLYRQHGSTGAVEYYHYDYRGSTIATTDASQNILKQYQYDPFGKIMQQTPAVASDDNPFRFVGQHGVQYENANLYFMRARYYDPNTGKFLSEDPIWSTNLYAYGDNNPVNFIDVNGKNYIKPNECGSRADGSNTEILIPDNPVSNPKYLLSQAALSVVIGKEIKGDLDFSTACNYHDKCYDSYGVTQGFCDARLKEIAIEKNGNKAVVTATLYEKGLNVVGKTAFDEAQSKINSCFNSKALEDLNSRTPAKSKPENNKNALVSAGSVAPAPN